MWGLIAVSVYYFLPVRYLITKYCVPKDQEEDDQAPYQDNFLFFVSDYDRENPVTK
jgi:hypothetical protein